jgi:Zn-dependent protease with chaperone function
MPAARAAILRRSLALVALLVAGLLVAAATPAAAARFRPDPGTVVVRDAITPSNHVSFYVPAGAAVGPREVAAAAAAAGLPNEGVEERDARQPGVRELRLRTTVSARTSWLSRRIDGRALGRLDVGGQGRVVLQLHPWATVTQGEVRPLESDLFARRYELTGEADVAWRIPASALVRALLLLLALAVVPFVVLRAYAGRVVRRDLDDTEKAHRLRAALLVAGLLLPIVMLGALFLGGLVLLPELLLGGLAPGATGSEAANVTASAVFLIAVVVIVLVPAARAVAPAYRRLRGVTATRASRTGNLRLGLAMLLPALVLVAVNLGAAFGLDPAVRLGLLGLSWVAIIVVGPLLAVRLMPSRPLEEPLRSRVGELLRRGGVRVREVRVLDTRGQKVANAVVMGPVPRLRYILLTDHLLQSMEQDEVEAVVAHEMGHAKQHHLLVKLGALVALTAAPVAALALGGRRLLAGADPLVVALAVPVLLVVAVLLVQGGLGLLLERKADEYAARLVGVDPTVRALEKLADSNMLKRRTGALWNLATNHPGIAQRVERLRGRRDVAPDRPREPLTPG